MENTRAPICPSTSSCNTSNKTASSNDTYSVTSIEPNSQAPSEVHSQTPTEIDDEPLSETHTDPRQLDLDRFLNHDSSTSQTWTDIESECQSNISNEFQPLSINVASEPIDNQHPTLDLVSNHDVPREDKLVEWIEEVKRWGRQQPSRILI